MLRCRYVDSWFVSERRYSLLSYDISAEAEGEGSTIGGAVGDRKGNGAAGIIGIVGYACFRVGVLVIYGGG